MFSMSNFLLCMLLHLQGKKSQVHSIFSKYWINEPSALLYILLALLILTNEYKLSVWLLVGKKSNDVMSK